MLKNNDIIKYIGLFIFLVLIQVTVLNRISFLNYGTPFVYIYFIIKLPIATNRNLMMILAFFLGLSIDIFCNTLGINAAATVLIAFFRRPIQSLFFTVEDFEEEVPRLSTQRTVFLKWTILLTFIHHLTLLSLESFSLFNLKSLIFKVILSTILTTVIIFAFEGLFLNRKNRE